MGDATDPGAGGLAHLGGVEDLLLGDQHLVLARAYGDHMGLVRAADAQG